MIHTFVYFFVESIHKYTFVSKKTLLAQLNLQYQIKLEYNYAGKNYSTAQTV